MLYGGHKPGEYPRAHIELEYPLAKERWLIDHMKIWFNLEPLVTRRSEGSNLN